MGDIIISKDILKHWDLDDGDITQIYPSSWAVGEKYVLKTGSNVDWLKNNLTISCILSKHGIPVAEAIKTIDGKDYVLEDGTYYFVSRRLAGKHLDIFSGDPARLSYETGRIIARLHIAFEACQNEVECFDNGFYGEMTGWVMQEFREGRAIGVPEEILEGCIAELGKVYPKLKRQLIHRDIHMGNMLFEGDKLTGYIDFDLSQINARLFDICYMCLGLLSASLNDSVKVEMWFDMVHQLFRGYEELLPLSEEEKSAVWIMMASIEILFVAYYASVKDPGNMAVAVEMLKLVWASKDRLSAGSL